MMFVKFTTDSDKRLQHLFWVDGESQMNYKVFDDIVAFDATYRKNKYLCPLVIFSGVNHHNQTIVFATGLVSNETEETYVWLLEQFLEVMGGKAPSSVITDGDLAMKNAIRRVFPEAHHRLCAWHLLRNATSNVNVPEFHSYFKKCMFGDYSVGKFDEIWREMITKCGLENNNWVQDLYQKRKMWATALMRGKFFAGIRTTSRCEALHCHIGKFVHSRISLNDFVQQFQRCLTYFRFREVEADFESNYGEMVLQTTLRSIERSASRKFTNSIFYQFRDVLKKSSLTRVLDCHEMSTYSIYSVSKYRGSGKVWHVSCCLSPIELKCSCLKMESVGFPCEHIVTVLVFLDFDELPDCLVMSRWSKKAKDAIRGSYTDGSFYWDSQLVAKQANLHFLCKEIVEVAHRDDGDYNYLVELLTRELNNLKLKHRDVTVGENVESETVDEVIYDPEIIRTKGCGPSTTSGTEKIKRSCKGCGVPGHNRRSCKTCYTTYNKQKFHFTIFVTMYKLHQVTL
ncbi:protein FAR1-RELATED SEQUENCE 5-like [Trifolium pratense]|uniref:protein FAR1-RELATED SEQUENCE 5-like n=1 Tax=Trifolium pratense TaxID=57577 RepID=UPI001E695B2F|nr:protein FAR1-RELATED SEQUENCE 5-like [Trifolium pratense]